MLASTAFKTLRWCSLINGASNAVVLLLGAILVGLAYPDCRFGKDTLPFVAVSVGSCLRILVMIRAGIVQKSTATMVLESLAPSDGAVLDAVLRHEKRVILFGFISFVPFF